jgi:hypothetical protein
MEQGRNPAVNLEEVNMISTTMFALYNEFSLRNVLSEE